ncbi:hypothetical protein [Micromonospora sp. NBC_00421]|uniref:hypothetical protein n=1 Tax=Micromonospora sp. NBC_00421 TaxID=2975976 RepID=UPI002E23B280
MQETRHTVDSVRYLYSTPTGILEFRARPTNTTIIETLIVHIPQCDGDQCAAFDYDCDAENGADIALYWAAGGDAGVWYGLAEYAVAQEAATIHQGPHEASHEQRAFRGRLIAEGRRMETDPDYFN